MLAHMDRSGSLIALLPSVQGFGQFISPNVAASVPGAGMGYSVMFIVSGSMALVAMLLYIGIFITMHRRPRVLAEATCRTNNMESGKLPVDLTHTQC